MLKVFGVRPNNRDHIAAVIRLASKGLGRYARGVRPFDVRAVVLNGKMKLHVVVAAGLPPRMKQEGSKSSKAIRCGRQIRPSLGT